MISNNLNLAYNVALKTLYSSTEAQEIVCDFCMITGRSEKELFEDIINLICDLKDAKKFYMAMGRFPDYTEQRLLNSVGFGVWFEVLRRIPFNQENIGYSFK